ncbi:hypothetical protein Ddc_15271 [Ditylenchus destructor]|nr:hypothetical protein Ddc_15271 [Ditylenchus destructor]
MDSDQEIQKILDRLTILGKKISADVDIFNQIQRDIVSIEAEIERKLPSWTPIWDTDSADNQPSTSRGIKDKFKSIPSSVKDAVSSVKDATSSRTKKIYRRFVKKK